MTDQMCQHLDVYASMSDSVEVVFINNILFTTKNNYLISLALSMH